MDTARFDALTRRLVESPSRRRLLYTMLASASAFAGIAIVGSPIVEATNRKRKNTKKCNGDKKRCRNQCFDLQTDPRNCGRCDKCCAVGEACRTGACLPNPQALGCTAEDSICRDDVDSNIHNCNEDNGFCGSLNDGAPVCMSAANCVACTSERECITFYQTLGSPEAQRALCIGSCPHCNEVFGVKTVCIIPAVPLNS
jgi:hypothetical protein